MKIVFATNNLNKLREIKALMPSNIEIVGLSDIGCSEEIPETGATLEANAFQKANYVKEHYGYDCFSDDSGLEIESLNGEPGVYSARYAGPEKNAQANMTKILNQLKGVENRNAQLRTVIALILEGEKTLFEGKAMGTISEKEQGEEGFGYDPIFIPENERRSFAQMTMKEKGEISHRGKAVRRLISFLTEMAE
jgi:XTP/dITP diphosphohydrolase